MNDIDKMPVKCRDCPYWELAVYPWSCGDCKDRLKKPVSDFVSRQWLIDEYHRRHEDPSCWALKMIEEAPAADVEPKRKTGRWIERSNGLNPYCSECHAIGDRSPFCRHCGAKMDGGGAG